MGKVEYEYQNRTCPMCGHKPLLCTVGYSCPAVYMFTCTNCHHVFNECDPNETGIRILRGEEAVRKRPQMYLDCDDEELRQIAIEEIERRKKNGKNKKAETTS